MCFGPVASFASGAVLTGAGTVTLKTARSKNELLLASFPLFFGIQQIIEGFVWLSIRGHAFAAQLKLFSAAFLFFAYNFWPVFSPLAILLLEPDKKRKRLLAVFFLLGIITAVYLAWFFFHYDHTVTVVHHSIQYHVHKFANFVGFMYLGATYVPYLISSYRGIKILGVLNIIFAAVSRYMYWKTFDSVWCFFAALLSIGLFIFLRSQHKTVGPASKPS